jgi:nitrite reductase/ring-hydroxylating ferredoxin subunit
MNDGFFLASDVASIGEGEAKRVEIGAMLILIYRYQGQFYSTSAFCPHQDVSLDPNNCQGNEIICKSHGYRMNFTTGVCMTDPSLFFPAFQTKVDSGQVWVKLK